MLLCMKGESSTQGGGTIVEQAACCCHFMLVCLYVHVRVFTCTVGESSVIQPPKIMVFIDVLLCIKWKLTGPLCFQIVLFHISEHIQMPSGSNMFPTSLVPRPFPRKPERGSGVQSDSSCHMGRGRTA